MSENFGEPWKVFDAWNVINSDQVAAARIGGAYPTSGILAQGDMYATAATWQRVVACINACQGISTEALEAGAVAELVQLGTAILQWYVREGQGTGAGRLMYGDGKLEMVLAKLGVYL